MILITIMQIVAIYLTQSRKELEFNAFTSSFFFLVNKALNIKNNRAAIQK